MLAVLPLFLVELKLLPPLLVELPLVVLPLFFVKLVVQEVDVAPPWDLRYDLLFHLNRLQGHLDHQKTPRL